MRRRVIVTSALVLALAVPQTILSATLRRGPWLQDVTTDGVTVIWQSDQVEAAAPVLRFGDSDACLGGQVTASHRDVNGLPVYAARITGLTTQQCYHYCLDYDAQIRTFCTAHAAGSSDFRFYVVGDNRNNPSTWQALSDRIVDDALQLPARHQTFVLHTGDLIGNGGVESDWDQLFPPARRMMERLPMYVAFGNHEDRNNATSDAFIYGFFDNPAASSGSSDEKWYGFRFGNVYTTSLAVYDNTSYSSGAQHDWLSTRQAAVAGQSGVRWRLGILHFAPWSVGNHGASQASGLRSSIHPIYRNNGVDLVLAGHNHLYARYAAIDGVTYVTAGGGGAGLHSGGYSAWSGGQLESLLQDYSFVTIDVSATAMTLRAQDLAGVTVDHVTFGGSAGNRPPYADAGADQQVLRGATVTLDGTASSDAEGTNLSYLWQQRAGPSVNLQAASSAVASFSATSSGRVVLSLIVNDGSHESTADVVQVQVTAGLQTHTPQADTYIDNSAAGRNFGNDGALLVDEGPTAYWSYLRFDLSSVAAQVVNARLRVYCTDVGDSADVLTSPDVTWVETTPTWSAPLVSGSTVYASLPAPGAGIWAEASVLAAVQAGQRVTFILRPSGTNGGDFESREGAHPPQLVLTLGDSVVDAGPRDSHTQDRAAGDLGGHSDTGLVQPDDSAVRDAVLLDSRLAPEAGVSIDRSNPDSFVWRDGAVADVGDRDSAIEERPIAAACACRAPFVSPVWPGLLLLWVLGRRKSR